MWLKCGWHHYFIPNRIMLLLLLLHICHCYRQFTNLGVIVDENLSLYKPIATMSRAVYLPVRSNGIIRKHINQSAGSGNIYSRARYFYSGHVLINASRLQKNAAKTTPTIINTAANSLTSHLSLNNYTGYKSNGFVFKTIHSVSPTFYVYLLNSTFKSVNICALETNCY